VAVLEHNRLDLLTLAALTARLLHLTRSGPEAARVRAEALGLGHVYARGACGSARTAFRSAIERCRSPRTRMIRSESRRSDRSPSCCAVGAATRKRHRPGELLAIRGCPPLLEREATAALAIHHEHQASRFDLSESVCLATSRGGAAADLAGRRATSTGAA
jgi:hypothetical protein